LFINIGIDGDFAPWVGALVGDVRQPLLLITDEGREEETVTRLTRVGFDNLLGHLKGGFKSWLASGKEVDTINRITAKEFEEVKQKISSAIPPQIKELISSDVNSEISSTLDQVLKDLEKVETNLQTFDYKDDAGVSIDQDAHMIGKVIENLDLIKGRL
jgi:hypothetical protein